MSRQFFIAALLALGVLAGAMYYILHSATQVGATDAAPSHLLVELKDANVAPDKLADGVATKLQQYGTTPFAIYASKDASEATLNKVQSDSRVVSVSQDQILKKLTDTPIPTIGGSASTGFNDGTANYTGSGYAVAVIDTGVDKNHAALSGKVIAEACFGVNGDYLNGTVTSLCPGGKTFSSAAGSGQDCTMTGCGHGTAVAGAAAMPSMTSDIDADSTPDNLSGSAKNAKIVAVKVVSKVQEKAGYDMCGDGISTVSTCALPLESAYLTALNYVATLSASQPIAAANLSIGSASDFAANDAQCNTFSSTSVYNKAATALRNHNIAPIVAAGNSGASASLANKISTPACASKAIAVAATNITGTAIASYSNNGPLVDLLAPGGDYDGTNADTVMFLPKNGTASGLVGEQGTSFAAPTVAGAFAVLREKHPNASVDSLLSLLKSTGTSVTDTRSGYTVGAKRLIQVDKALVASPLPVINSFTGPSGAVNEGSSMKVDFTVSNSTKCTLDNGVGTVWTSGSGNATKTVPVKSKYKLTCTNAYGDSVSKTLSVTTNAAPTKPASLKGTANFDRGTYLLSWGESKDSNGVANYLVYVNGKLVATLANTVHSYKVTGLQVGQKYSFAVKAVDTLGASSTASTSTVFAAAAQLAGGTDTKSNGVGAPNTGIAPLQSVGFWQIAALVVTGLATIGAIYKFQFAPSKK